MSYISHTLNKPYSILNETITLNEPYIILNETYHIKWDILNELYITLN